MSSINSRSLLLLMIGLGSKVIDGQVGGITRLQKFLFLLEKENPIKYEGKGFEFIPYKAGPYSEKLYDDIEFLENLGYLESEIVGELTIGEASEVDALQFEDLVGDVDDLIVGPADAYVEKSFKITEKGREKITELIESKKYIPFIEGIRKVKSKFGSYSLSDLLYYVYSNFPEMIVESKIRDQVLGGKF